jgi:aspartate/methionine/tyrosine aminotransferase
VSPENVLIVPGGKVTMFMAILMFGEPGAEILYPGPRLPDLPFDDRVHGGDPRAGADPRGERLLRSRRRRRSR